MGQQNRPTPAGSRHHPWYAPHVVMNQLPGTTALCAALLALAALTACAGTEAGNPVQSGDGLLTDSFRFSDDGRAIQGSVAPSIPSDATLRVFDLAGRSTLGEIPIAADGTFEFFLDEGGLGESPLLRFQIVLSDGSRHEPYDIEWFGGTISERVAVSCVDAPATVAVGDGISSVGAPTSCDAPLTFTVTSFGDSIITVATFEIPAGTGLFTPSFNRVVGATDPETVFVLESPDSDTLYVTAFPFP